MRPFYIKSRPLVLTLALAASVSCGAAYAGPLAVQHVLSAESHLPLQAVHYRSHLSPWQAPFHVSRWYRGGNGARMGLVAQGIIPPPRHPHYSYPSDYQINYFYYPNYRMIHDF